MTNTRTPRQSATGRRTTSPTTPRRTRRTTEPVVEPVVDPTEMTENESVTEYVDRMLSLATTESVAAAKSALQSADDSSRVFTFTDRVQRAYAAGRIISFETRAAVPDWDGKSFAIVSGVIGVTAKNGGKYLGRAYSTLTECLRVARGHNAEAFTAFVDAWRETHDGVHPEQVREYAAWVTAPERYKNAATLSARAATAADAAAKATERAAADTARTTELVTAGTVDALPMVTAETWAALTENEARDVILLATAVRKLRTEERIAAKRAADRMRRENESAAETGPTPSATPRVTVQA